MVHTQVWKYGWYTINSSGVTSLSSQNGKFGISRKSPNSRISQFCKGIRYLFSSSRCPPRCGRFKAQDQSPPALPSQPRSQSAPRRQRVFFYRHRNPYRCFLVLARYPPQRAPRMRPTAVGQSPLSATAAAPCVLIGACGGYGRPPGPAGADPLAEGPSITIRVLPSV